LENPLAQKDHELSGIFPTAITPDFP